MDPPSPYRGLGFLLKIFEVIQDKPGVKVREIARIVGAPLEEVQIALIQMKRKGYIRQLPRKRPRKPK